MTLQNLLSSAAFWHEAICLECFTKSDSPTPGVLTAHECPECGGGLFLDAEALQELLALVSRDEEETASLD